MDNQYFFERDFGDGPFTIHVTGHDKDGRAIIEVCPYAGAAIKEDNEKCAGSACTLKITLCPNEHNNEKQENENEHEYGVCDIILEWTPSMKEENIRLRGYREFAFFNQCMYECSSPMWNYDNLYMEEETLSLAISIKQKFAVLTKKDTGASVQLPLSPIDTSFEGIRSFILEEHAECYCNKTSKSFSVIFNNVDTEGNLIEQGE